jgi:hypothetical protein
MVEIVLLLQYLDHAMIDLTAHHADCVIAQFGDAGDGRSRWRYDHHDAMRGQRDGARLLQIADIGPHNGKAGVARIECLRRVEYAAGILDFEPDPCIGLGETTGDERSHLFCLTVQRANGNRQRPRLHV